MATRVARSVGVGVLACAAAGSLGAAHPQPVRPLLDGSDVWKIEETLDAGPSLDSTGWVNFAAKNLPRGMSALAAQRRGSAAVALVNDSAFWWLLFSDDGGEHWERPVFVPHLAALCCGGAWLPLRNARMPLVNKGVVRIEAQWWGGGGDSPQTMESQALGTVKLSVLNRDSDGDGLTDLFEQRVGLDPQNADTDHDGIPNGIDPLPLIPKGQRAIPASLVYQATFLNPLLDETTTVSDDDATTQLPSGGPVATTCLIGDPSVVGDPAPYVRLFVYPRRTRGEFCSASFELTSDPSDPRPLLTWDRQNSGASGHVERTDHGWRVVIGEWSIE